MTHRRSRTTRIAALRALMFCAVLGTILLSQAMLSARPLQATPQSGVSPADLPRAATTDDYATLARQVLQLAAAERYDDAVVVADRAIRASEGQPVPVRLQALSNGGYVKRFAGDLAGAAAAYEQAVAIADAAGYEKADLGIVLDNLARVRAATADFAAAEAGSLRALDILRRTLGERNVNYGGALNNLALMYHAKGDHARAADYSDRAVEVLRLAFAGNPRALEPFLEDNRVIKAAAPPKQP